MGRNTQAIIACAGSLALGATANAEITGPPAPMHTFVPAEASSVEAPAVARRAANPNESLPLGAPEPEDEPQEPSAASMPAWLDGWLVRTLVAMGGVIALIFVTRWTMQLGAGRSGALANQLGAGGRAPSGVLSVLGRYPIARGQSLVLLKLDRRVLLLSQTDAGFTTLSEISEAEDVASILLKTSDETGEGISERFDGLLREAERDPETARFDEHDLMPFESREQEDRPSDAAGTLRSRLERYQESLG